MYDAMKLGRVEGALMEPQQFSIRERLQRRLDDSIEYVAKLEHAMKMLNENPSFEAVHDAIAKAGF